MSGFMIEDIEIGNPNVPLVIPEVGINHGGKLSVAKEMVLSARNAGARIIKHQTHICEDEMCSIAKYVMPGNSEQSIYQIMENCSLNEEEESEFKRYVEELGMCFLSTPFSRKAAERLEKMGVSAYKIGSGELNNYPLIEHVAQYGKPMIVSTGMNDLRSIEKTVNLLEKKHIKYALLHTTNLYPTKSQFVRLGAMCELKNAFPGIPFGLSDHTLNNNACIAALALGATIVERHYTDTKDRVGPDIICSMDENELKDLLRAAQEVPQMLGGKKKALKEEEVTIAFAFASVVSIKPIKKGEMFTSENIWVKRPSGSILAEDYNKILGKRAICDIENDTQISGLMVDDYAL